MRVSQIISLSRMKYSWARILRMPRICHHGICGWHDFGLSSGSPAAPRWREDDMPSHPGRQDLVGMPRVSVRRFPCDPLDQFENVQQAVDRRCICHQNTSTAAASIRALRRGWMALRVMRSTLAPRISCITAPAERITSRCTAPAVPRHFVGRRPRWRACRRAARWCRAPQSRCAD